MSEHVYLLLTKDFWSTYLYIMYEDSKHYYSDIE